MSELKTNEPSEKKVYYIPCEMTREDAAFMGIDPKLVRPLFIDGRMSTGILVKTENEELHRAYCKEQSVRSQEIHKHSRCRLENANHRGYHFCRENCDECQKEMIPGIISLDALEDEGFETEDANEADAGVIESEFLKTLKKCIVNMKIEDQLMARAILNCIPDKPVMMLLGIEKQSTYSSRKMKVKKKLQAAMEEWL